MTYIGHIMSYLACNILPVLHIFVLIVDIICIDPIMSYLTNNVFTIFHIYSYSVNAWYIQALCSKQWNCQLPHIPFWCECSWRCLCQIWRLPVWQDVMIQSPSIIGHIHQHPQSIILSADFMFVNGIPLFITFRNHIKFITDLITKYQWIKTVIKTIK